MAFETSDGPVSQTTTEDSRSHLLNGIDRREALQIVRSNASLAQSDLRPTASAPNATEAVKQSTSCAPSPAYQEIIDKTARQIYDPKALGDIDSLKNKFNCDIKSPEDAIKFANKALMKQTDDPYNFAMTPNEFKQLMQDIRGNFGGIGVEVKAMKLTPDMKPIPEQEGDANRNPGEEPPKKADASDADEPSNSKPKEERTMTVYRVIPNGAAAKADVKDNDVVAGIDGKNTINLPLSDSVSLLRGPKGTPVHLELIRDGAKIERDLTRSDVKVETVTQPQDVGDGISYIRIKSFGDSTANDLEAAMKQAPNAKAFMIDVRNNPGGLVSTSTQSTEMFIKQGTIMTERQREESDPRNPVFLKQEYKLDAKHRFMVETDSQNPKVPHMNEGIGRHPYLAGDRPVIVLTNRNTASAAEIFTGALHDTAHATTVGTKTFGKGIGQSIVPGLQGDAGMKVTSLHYETPSGKWPGDAHNNRIGLDPDVIVAGKKGALFLSPDDDQFRVGKSIAKQKIAEASGTQPRK